MGGTCCLEHTIKNHYTMNALIVGKRPHERPTTREIDQNNKHAAELNSEKWKAIA